MKRSEFTSKLFAYCLSAGIIIGFLLCMILAVAAPQGLTEEEVKLYREIAYQYYETGEDDPYDNIEVSKSSNYQVSVLNNDKPLTPSMIFDFKDEEHIKEKRGINLNSIRLFPIIIGISIFASLIFAFAIWFVFHFIL